MKLKTSPTSNTYCVPAALALLLDCTVDEAEQLIKDELGDTPIRGVYYPIILKILKQKEFEYKEIRTFHERYSGEPSGKVLLCFHGHVGCWIDGKYYDNHYPSGFDRLYPSRIEKIFEITHSERNFKKGKSNV